MIFVITVHHRSERWIDVQRGFLSTHVSEPYQLWANLEGVEHRASDFDRVVRAVGAHAGKLNLMAAEACAVGDPSDLLMFLDGDAFPIADPMPMIRTALAASDLVAVRRAENAGDPQPHPSFAATTIATWTAVNGDWSPGYPWRSDQGERSDVGGNLLRLLQLHGKSWQEVRRSNRVNLHPVWFGVYGDVVYHHGAGFRSRISRADRELQPPALLAAHAADRFLGPPIRLANAGRRVAWERRLLMQRKAEDAAVFEQILTNPEFYKQFL